MEPTKVDSADTFERPIYAGNAIATVQSADAVKVITVRNTGFNAAAATGGSAAVETAAAVADSGKSSFVGSEVTKSDRSELTAAKIIVSDGRALGSAEKFTEVITPPGRQAGCGHRCQPCGCRCGLRAQRPASGPDGQDRGASVVHCLWHLGCDPASGGYEGLEGDRGDQLQAPNHLLRDPHALPDQ
ncbi:hypothetical protein Cthiooxydans_37480 [Comamonas thiooxydans]|nr:hypothetical protein Cthiooxydans_37480 [Comamonas thiooxydans]